MQIAINIAGTVPSGKYYRTEKLMLDTCGIGYCDNTSDHTFFNDKIRHAHFEMHFATALQDSVTHILYYSR